MLGEAVALMRRLWEGDLCSWDGPHYRLEDARLYTLPDEPIDVVVAASGVEAAELAAVIGDGLVSTAPDPELVDRYARSGGGGPRYGQLTVCYARTEEEARRIALEMWPNAGLQGSLSQELPLPRHFEEAAAMVDEDTIAEFVVCGPDPDAHLAAINRYVDAGFDHVYVHQVGSDQDAFFDFYAANVLPAAASLAEPQSMHA
jgi:G6PDH family F420-dependent oxidoreductase